MHDPLKPDLPDPGGEPHQFPPLPDLPPVEAPSAGFVVQLFVIPAIVVAVVILVWLLFGKLAGGERDPAEYVRRLRQASGDWRSAFELASLIQNDAKLANDPHLLGELSDLLSTELKAKDVDPQLTVYLIKTLGAFQTLEATLADGRKVDPIEPLVQALQPRSGPAIRMEAAATLAKQAARLQGKLDDPRVATALSAGRFRRRSRTAPGRRLRPGIPGGRPRLGPLQERIQSDDNRFVRYNAAVALGRRGDVTAVGTLKEMLSSAALDRVIDLPSKPRSKTRSSPSSWRPCKRFSLPCRQGQPSWPAHCDAEVEDLTQSGLASVRSQAQAVLQELQSASVIAASSVTGTGRGRFARLYRDSPDLGAYRSSHPPTFATAPARGVLYCPDWNERHPACQPGVIGTR